MKILRAYKTELDPNNKQRTFFRRCAGTARFVFNWALADRQMKYRNGEKTSQYDQRRRFNAIKDEQCPWVREVPYAVTEAAFANCDAAFQNFFRRVKNGEKPGYPKFKRRGQHDSFQLRNTQIDHDRIRLTQIGWVRLKERGYIPVGAARYGVYATVSERAGRWFISVLVEEELPDPIDQNEFVIGVDFGIKYLAVCSDGMIFENPRALYEAERRLKRLQRELSRRQRGSKNREKTRRKLARQHARIANIRNHTLHQVSHYVTTKVRPRMVVIEDLNISGMMQNHHLARAISDVGMAELRRQIEYKGAWYGVGVVIADRWYPSSKTCSNCGSVKPMLTLSERLYVCEECGLIVDRDLNAALNLAALSEGPNRPGLPGELGRNKAPLRTRKQAGLEP